MANLNVQIPLANGGFIQIQDDPSVGGFLLLNILNPDGSQNSSTPITSAQSQGILEIISGAANTRKGAVAAGLS